MTTSNTLDPKRIEELLLKRAAARREAGVELTDAQKKRMQSEEPSEKQVSQLQGFKVPEAEIAQMTKFDASEALDRIFAEIAKRNAAPASKKMIAALQKWGFELADIKGISMGDARKLLNSVAPPLKRDPNETYVSKNPLWKAAKKGG